MRSRILPFVVVLSACSSGGGGGVRWDPVAVAPARPELHATADTNSALMYYTHGLTMMEQNPTAAAASFYWASRLDPTWADPIYARRLALLVTNPERYLQYLDDESPIHDSPGMIALDSLLMRALEINPLIEPAIDLAALNYVVELLVRRRDPSLLSANIDHLVHGWLLRQEPDTRAWYAYADGRYGDALELYETAHRLDPENLKIRYDMAHVLFRLNRYDDAVTAMTGAIDAMRANEETRLVRVYESKAIFEHFIGLVHEQQGDVAAARDAYARALGEDLAYHPAHLRLGEIALAARDSAAALGELALAAQIRENDPLVRFRYGLLLIQMGRFAEAEAQLRRAVELEPLFADPYRLLAVAIDFQGRPAEAAPIYREFLARGSVDASGRDAVNRRLAQIGTPPTGGSSP